VSRFPALSRCPVWYVSPGIEANLYMRILDSTFAVSSFPPLNVENAADAIEKLTTKVTMTEGDEFGGRFSKNRAVGAARGDF